MLPVQPLFKDLYHERWGDPDNPEPVNEPTRRLFSVRRMTDLPAALASLFHRQSPSRPSAWSFTLPIDRRLR